MVTIIIPFYKSEKYLKAAIASVLSQSFQKWELLLINDGSKDQSKYIVESFQDSRIKYFEQENRGVAAARNVGLDNMKGDYFCFLDADDVLPPNSLKSRLKVFEKSADILFVDGVVHKMDEGLATVNEKWSPSFYGNPFTDLIKLTGKSFLGLTWLIKRNPKETYRFEEGLTHCEDLFFYLQLTQKGGVYAYTSDVILHYRDNPTSAMKNLKGLEKGYRFIENRIKDWATLDKLDNIIYKYKYRKAMILAYIKQKHISSAFKMLFN